MTTRSNHHSPKHGGCWWLHRLFFGAILVPVLWTAHVAIFTLPYLDEEFRQSSDNFSLAPTKKRTISRLSETKSTKGKSQTLRRAKDASIKSPGAVIKKTSVKAFAAEIRDVSASTSAAIKKHVSTEERSAATDTKAAAKEGAAALEEDDSMKEASDDGVAAQRVANRDGADLSIQRKESTITKTDGRLSTYYAFVRIPKTGSTSVLSFLGTESGMVSWDKFLYSATDYIKASSTKFQKKAPFCIYGHQESSIEEKNTARDATDDNPFDLNNPEMPFMECPHLKHFNLHKYWQQSLKFTVPPSSIRKQPTLQSFSMIRNPFGRLRSLFYYVQNHCEDDGFWDVMFTKEQYQKVCANDFKGWMQLLHDQGGGKTAGVPYQYRIFDNDSVDRAVNLITSGEVIMFVNECFELSLRLMEERFAFDKGATDAFLDSDYFDANVNYQAPEQSAEEAELIHAAKVWFMDDYKFYNAAVQQFQQMVHESGIDLSTLENACPLLDEQVKIQDLEDEDDDKAVSKIATKKLVKPSKTNTLVKRAVTKDRAVLASTKSAKSRPTFYAFVRITKTGSTSVVSFLGTESELISWDNFLYSATGYIEASATKFEKKAPFCIYGHQEDSNILNRGQRDPRDGVNPFDLNDLTESYVDCPHLRHSQLHEYWRKSLTYSVPPNSTEPAFQPILQSFSMIRDPFSRLRSMFYYVQKHCEGNQMWNVMFTKEQYAKICEDDLKGWMQLLHEQGGGVTLGVPNQYRLFDENSVDRAISLISSGKAVVFVNECFELSLRLMEERFSFQEGATDAFLDSDNFDANVNYQAPKQSEDEKELMKSAKVWFKDEYRFYNAAVKQFRQMVKESGINLNTLENECPLVDEEVEQREEDARSRDKHHATVVSATSSKIVPRSTTSIHTPSIDTNTTMLAFLRIQKTGSTAFLSFLTYMSRLHSWDDFIYSATDYVKSSDGNHFIVDAPFCIFGHAPNGGRYRFEHDPRDGDNPYDYNMKHKHNKCPHIYKNIMQRYWRRTLAFANHPAGNKNLSLQFVTMVREPFDRMRSFYYYVKKYCKTTQAWEGMFTTAQYRQICHGDFGTWLGLIHVEGSAKVENQYHFINEDVDNAIRQIESDDTHHPKVYMLLNECFEESVRFVEKKFSLQPGVADDFVDSDRFYLNKNNVEPTPEEEALRGRAKKWFASDYKFYNAAIKQFRQQLATVDINPSTLQYPCDILREPKQSNTIDKQVKKR